MVCRKNEKTAGLLIVAFVLLFALVHQPDWSSVGISIGCHAVQRFAYPFFHASFIHAMLNVWCFVSILFVHDIAWWRLATAYLIAVATPDFALSTTPTVGLSAVCFALLGSIAFQTRRKLYYNGCMALYIALGFLFPHLNAWLHLYSYVAGLIVGLLDIPIQCSRK